MRILCRFRPRLIGSVMTGHVRKGSDIDLHVFSDRVEPITELLEEEGCSTTSSASRSSSTARARVFTHIHVYDRFNFELTVYAEDKAHYVFKSSITGKAIERAIDPRAGGVPRPRVSRREPRRRPSTEREEAVDPYQLFRLLLLAAGEREADRRSTTPRATCSITCCRCSSWPATRGRTTRSSCWRRCCTTSARGSTRHDHVGAACRRWRADHGADAFLIEHHMLAQEYKAGTLGYKARKRLEASEDFEDLMLLRELDTAAAFAALRSHRGRGARVPQATGTRQRGK